MSGRPRLWQDPAKLLRHLGVTRPEDIDIEAIAGYCRARVSYQPLRGCEGRIVGHRGRAVIVVDRDAHPYRRRFTIAHELGHWMFDRADLAHVFTDGGSPTGGTSETDEPPTANQGPLDDWYEDRPEQRANRWAAELLMPETFFAPDATGREISFATARDLARRYRTSLTATALRLLDLGSTPAMIVCRRRHQRHRWFKRGAGLPRDMWPHPEPQLNAVACDLLRGFPTRTGPVGVPADAWIKRKDAWWYRVSEDSIPIGDGEVLSLLSWPDDAQLRATFTISGTWLPWKPGKGARAKLVKCLCDKWSYRRRRGEPGEAVLETTVPSPHRLVVPPLGALHAEGFRRLVDEVAGHRGVTRGVVLWSMLKRPKWLDRQREAIRDREDIPPVTTPPWIP